MREWMGSVLVWAGAAFLMAAPSTAAAEGTLFRTFRDVCVAGQADLGAAWNAGLRAGFAPVFVGVAPSHSRAPVSGSSDEDLYLEKTVDDVKWVIILKQFHDSPPGTNATAKDPIFRACLVGHEGPDAEALAEGQLWIGLSSGRETAQGVEYRYRQAADGSRTPLDPDDKRSNDAATAAGEYRMFGIQVRPDATKSSFVLMRELAADLAD